MQEHHRRFVYRFNPSAFVELVIAVVLAVVVGVVEVRRQK